MDTADIKVESNGADTGIIITNLKIFNPALVIVTGKLKLTGSIAATTTEKALTGTFVNELLASVNATKTVLFQDIFATEFAVSDYYKVTLEGYNVSGVQILNSNIEAFFTTTLLKQVIKRKYLEPVTVVERDANIYKLSKAMILTESLDVLNEDVTLDREISVTSRIKLLKRDFV